MKTLIAGIGQPWMRDLAFGSHVVRYLHSAPPRENIEVSDLSFGPLAAFQMIRDGNYRKIVFITSRAAGRQRRILYETVPSLQSLPPEEIHARIGDSVMGCVSLENLVVVCRFHGVLPEQTFIVEVEPEDDTWGPDLSDGLAPLVAAAAHRALAIASV